MRDPRTSAETLPVSAHQASTTVEVSRVRRYSRLTVDVPGGKLTPSSPGLTETVGKGPLSALAIHSGRNISVTTNNRCSLELYTLTWI